MSGIVNIAAESLQAIHMLRGTVARHIENTHIGKENSRKLTTEQPPKVQACAEQAQCWRGLRYKSLEIEPGGPRSDFHARFEAHSTKQKQP